MKTPTSLRSLRSVPLFLALLFSLTAVAAEAQTAPKTQDKLPAGNYNVITKPYMGPGYESLPVMVTSVTTEAQSNGGVTIVGVENGTSRRLDAVRLSWYLSSREAPDYVLLQGKSPMLRLPGGIAAGAVERVQFPVVSFAKIHKPLARDGVVSGNYLIQVGAVEARFDDGTAQTFLALGKKGGKRETVFVKANWPGATSRPPAPARQIGCPNQSCSPVYEGDGNARLLVGYDCAGSQGSTCTNQPGGKSCTNTVCGKEGGGGGNKPPIQPVLQ
jgi:hypothetical protein